MRRFVHGSLGRSRINIEELECRAQPAQLGLGLSLHALDTPPALHASAFVSTSANATLPTHANEHAQVAVALHSHGHVGNPPTEPPTTPPTTPPTDPPGGGVGGGIGGGIGGDNGGVTNPPPGNDTPASDLGPSTTPDVFAPSAVSITFVFVRETTTPVFVATPASAALAASSLFASSGLLLPPDRTVDAATALAPATGATSDAATSSALAPVGAGRFPGATSIPYLSGDSPVAATAFEAGSRAATKAEVATENARPGAAATPVKTAHRLDRAIDAPADEAVVLAPFLVPAANPDAFAAPAADVVPVAVPIAVEEGPATWTWAAGVIGAAAGASWAARRYWLKPAPAKQPDPRAWQRYLLGADFDRS